MSAGDAGRAAPGLLEAFRSAPDAGDDPLLTAVHRAFARTARVRTHARALPPPGNMRARSGTRLHRALLFAGGAVALGDERYADRVDTLLERIENLVPDPDVDEMFVAYLAIGLVAFSQLAGTSLTPGTWLRLLASVSRCDAWLAAARSTKPYGTRDTPGNDAWNHSVVAALAGAATALDRPPDDARASAIAFGLERLDRFLEHGIAVGGAPYEGWSYWALSAHIVGLCRILFRVDPPTAAAYEAVLRRHRPRLQALLGWLEACCLPDHACLVTWNQSRYEAAEVLPGLLSLFDDDAARASQLWRRIAEAAVRDGRSLSGWPLFEARILLRPASTRPLPGARDRVDLEHGYALFADGDGERAHRLFVKASSYLSGPHNQADANHFTWVAAGFPWFVDAGVDKRGRHRRSEGGTPDAATREGRGTSSFGHNAIIVDGRGQYPGGGRASLHGYRQDGDVTLLSGTATPAYRRHDYNPVHHAHRHWAIRRGQFPWLFVFDDIVRLDRARGRFERRLLLPAWSERPRPPADRLHLVYRGQRRTLALRRGASAPLRTACMQRPGPDPFGTLTVLVDHVDAVRPCFWMLAWPEEPGTPDWRVRAFRDLRGWRFAIDGDGPTRWLDFPLEPVGRSIA